MWLLGLIICDSLNPLQVSKAFPDDPRGTQVCVYSYRNIFVFCFATGFIPKSYCV